LAVKLRHQFGVIMVVDAAVAEIERLHVRIGLLEREREGAGGSERKAALAVAAG
jgi:hypothetical protein